MRRLLAKAAACVAATALTAGMAVTASADDKYMKLISADFPSCIEGASYCYEAGDEYFSLFNTEWNLNCLVLVGENELNKWRESGEFSYENAKTDYNFENCKPYEPIGAWDYLCLTTDSSQIDVLRLDRKNNEMTHAYSADTTEYNSKYGLSNGCIFAVKNILNSNNRLDSVCVTIFSPDGEKHETDFDYDNAPAWLAYDYCVDNTADGEYIGYFIRNNGDDSVGYSLYGFSKDGSYETLWNDDSQNYRWMYGSAMNCSGCVVWETENETTAMRDYYVYSDGKVYDWEWDLERNSSGMACLYTDMESEENLEFPFAGFDGDIFNQKAVAKFQRSTMEHGDDKSVYALVDITDGKILSDVYLSMNTYDGKKYLVKTLDGKWGYMNSKGKLLKTYDDAGGFKGDYAPVVKNGKGFLIDRDFNRVSEKIDADGCRILSDGLYVFDQDDNSVAVTFVRESAEESKPEEPKPEESQPEEPKPDESQPEEIKIDEPKPEKVDTDNSSETGGTSSQLPDKANPETGAAGVAALLAVIAVGASAAVMFRRKK